MNLSLKNIIVKVDRVSNSFKYKEQIKKIGLFGSVARGETTEHSDIDLVVDFEYLDFGNPVLNFDTWEIEGSNLINLEVKKYWDFENLLRFEFKPIELSVVELDAVNQEGGIFKEELEKDVVWIYE